MCCGTESRHHAQRPGQHHACCCCGCGEPSSSSPTFWTDEEKVAKLTQYLTDLREEVRATEERIAALKGE